MKTINAKDYHEIKEVVRTIDVRTEQENKVLVRFDWADNIPIDDLFEDVEKYCPNKDERIVTVCNAGNRSSDAAERLNDMGYKNACVLTGGIYGYFRTYSK